MMIHIKRNCNTYKKVYGVKVIRSKFKSVDCISIASLTFSICVSVLLPSQAFYVESPNNYQNFNKLMNT